MREASLSWTEAYPATEYRHGPMSITDDTSVVWIFGDVRRPDCRAEIAAMGGMVVSSPGRDPRPTSSVRSAWPSAIGLARGPTPTCRAT